MITLSKPDITSQEIRAVVQVLKSGRLACGEFTEKFENALAKYIGVKYAVAVSSGTAGLHILMRVFDLKDGDEVITTPFSFIASANCILFERAKPVFVDINPGTLCIDSAKIEAAITPRTKAILAVDVFGHPADWIALQQIATKHNLWLLEDACEALGSSWQGKKCGSFGDAAVFAFYPNKQITTGEGGMITTNNKLVADQARALRNQGRAPGDHWLEHSLLGYNYRMDEMSAALGYTQIRRLSQILSKRQKIVNIYATLLKQAKLNIQIPNADGHAQVSWFVYVISLNSLSSSRQRDKIISALGAAGIETRNYFPAIHLQPVYRQLFGHQRDDYPLAEKIADSSLALPFYASLTKKEISYIIKTLTLSLKKYGSN